MLLEYGQIFYVLYVKAKGEQINYLSHILQFFVHSREMKLFLKPYSELWTLFICVLYTPKNMPNGQSFGVVVVFKM